MAYPSLCIPGDTHIVVPFGYCPCDYQAEELRRDR